MATALSISLNGGLNPRLFARHSPRLVVTCSTNYTSGLSRQKVLLLNSLKNIASHASAAQVGGGSRRVPTILKCPTHPEKVDKGNKNHFKKQTIESRYQI